MDSLSDLLWYPIAQFVFGRLFCCFQFYLFFNFFMDPLRAHVGFATGHSCVTPDHLVAAVRGSAAIKMLDD